MIRRSTGATGRFARLRFEELEPRILLSADVAPGLLLAGDHDTGVLPLTEMLHQHAGRELEQHESAWNAAAITDLYVVQPGADDALDRAESLARATCGSPALVVELDATCDGFAQLDEVTAGLAGLERVTVIAPLSRDSFAFGDANWDVEGFARRIEGVAARCGASFDLVASGDVAADAAAQRLELVFVDSRVADADALIADLLLQSDASVRYEVVSIDAGSDGLAQVGAALAGRHDVAALHVISHGADGGILFGAGFVDATALRGAAGSVGAWAGALDADADILLYGCDVAASDRGREFATLLAGLTGADVASSDDTTAAELLGGDWQLEYRVGEVSTALAVSKALQQSWTGRLALDAVGSEVPVNTTLAGTQSAAGSGPGAVAMDDAGNYVVVFEDSGSNAGDVFFRRFDATGTPLGAVTGVNTTLADRQYDARVAMAGNGTFVVTWTSNLQDGSGTGIYGRRFAADGTALGAEFRVNTTTAGDQSNSTVAMAGGGAFVVGWVTSDDGSGSGIRGQRYDAAGVAQGGELSVNVTTTQVQSGPSATITDSGNFGFVWQGQQSGSYDVYLRGYSAAGVPGGETVVNQTSVGAQTSVVIGVDAAGTNVVIAWASAGQDPDGSQGLYARRFNGAGVAQGGEFRVNTTTGGTQSAPVIAVDADGDFVVGWNDSGLDGSGSSVYLQRFDANGLRIGGEVRANTTSAADQAVAGVAIAGSHVAVAWEGNGTGDTAVVFTRAFTAVQYTTVTVSTTADTIDGADTSSIAALLAARGGDGQISLREALTAANNTAGPVRILFDVPAATVGGVHTISLDSLLPAIGNRVLIDGTTEPDHVKQPMIVLRVQDGFTVASGLRLNAGSDGSEIRGLAFQGFSSGALSIADSDGHTVAGNWFGLDATGTGAAGNNTGIALWNSGQNVIGGTSAADRNVISGSASAGIAMMSDDGSTTGNRVIGNYIGTNADGTAAVANRIQGVWIASAGNFVGGAAAGEGNVISGTTDWVGIELTSNASNTTIQGNYIGLDATGSNVITNEWGGIYLQSADNVIGGSAAGAGNVIAGGSGVGISIVGAGATGNVVTGNRIGTDVTGTLARGVAGDGIWIINDASGNRIGGTQPGEANWIANSGVNAIELSSAGSGNALLGNLAWSNGGLAIDLVGSYGVTANDPGDADIGSNALQNYPVLDTAIVNAAGTSVAGAISTTANTTLRLEFFSSPAADASGHGEASTYLGAVTVTTDGTGKASFGATLFGVSVATGHAVSATATVDLGGGNYGSTSEFSAAVLAAPLQAPSLVLPGAQVIAEDVPRTLSSADGTAIQVVDADAAGGAVEVTLTVDRGVLTLAGTGGLSFVTGDGTADSLLVFRGTVAAVNAALDGLVFTPPADYGGGATLGVTTRDAIAVGLEQDASLAGRYTFEGTAADVAPGTPQDGSLLGDASYATVMGRGQVLQLDGNGDAVQVAGVVGTQNVTIGGWVDLSALASGRTEFISLDDRVHIALDDYAGVKGAVQVGPGAWLDLNSNQYLAGGGWHHVMYVFDDVNDTHALYIDGQLAASATTSASIYWTGASSTWIGRHPTTTPGWDFEGQVDDVRIYGRALTAAEVASIVAEPVLQASGSVAIGITAVDDAPVLGFASGSFTYPENADAVVMAPFATVSDVDSPDFAGGSLVVTLTANGQPEDRLGIRHEGTGAGQVGVSGNVVTYGGVAIGAFSGGGDGSAPLIVSFNASASVAAVQAVGRNVTYQNVSESPSTLPRTVTGYVTDGDGGISNVVSGTINLQPANDAPVVTTTFGSRSYNENAGPVAIDPGITVVDVDSATLTGATVRIAVAYASGEDVLGFTNQSGITGSWDPGTGTLTLSGTATVAQYEAALRSVTYTNTSEDPSIAVRDVTFAVTDGAASSVAAMRQVQVASWQDAPFTSPSFAAGNEDASWIAVLLSGNDVDGTVASFTLSSLPANGTLYTDAGRTKLVTLGSSYAASGESLMLYFAPTANWNGSTTFQYFATDNLGMADMSPDTVTISVAPVNDAPVANAGGSYSIAEGGTLSLDGSASSDLDGDPLSYAWDLDGDGIYSEAGEPLTVSPTVSWTTLQGAGIVDDGVHVLGLRVTDKAGSTAYSKATLTVVNAAPTLVANGSGAANAGQPYTLNLGASDFGADTISAWTVNWGDGSIVTYAGNPASVTHTYASAGNFGVLVAATDEDGTHLQNTLLVPTWAGSDAVFQVAPGGSVLGQFGAASGLDDQAEIVVGPDGNLYVTSMSTGTVKRFAPDGSYLGDFVTPTAALGAPGGLSFGPDGNLYVVSYDHASVLRYDGSSGALLGSFVTAGSGGLSQPLGIAFGADGDLYVTSRGPDAILRYDGTSGAFVGVFVAAGPNGPNSPEDIAFGPDGHLYVANLGDSTVRRYDGTTGAWLGDFVTAGSGGLSGPAGLAFGPDGHLYVGSQATDSIKRYDGNTGAYLGDYVTAGAGGLDSPAYFNFLPQHRVAVSAAQPPVATPSGATATFTENGAAVAIDPALTVADADGATLVGATLRIAGNYAMGQDVLAFVDQGGITGSWDASSGTLTLSGAASLATYQQALRSITYANSSENPSTATRGLQLVLDDGLVTGPVANLALDVVASNDAPTTTAVMLVAHPEDGGPRVITQAELLANAADVDGGALVAGNLQLVSGAGSLFDNGDGTWTFTPAVDDDKGVAFSYTIADGAGGSIGGSALLDLTSVNDAPTTTPVGLAPLAEDGGPRVITQAQLLANANDIDGGALVASNLQLVAGAGSLLDNGDGTWTYTPAANDDTAATFSYTITDGNGGSTGGSASLDLTPVNDAPTTTPVVLAPLAEDGAPRVITQAQLLANAIDIDGGALVASNLQLVAGAGSLLDNGDGTWTYTPAANDDTAAAFSYTIVDGAGGSVGGTATLDLTPVNDAPTSIPVVLAPLAEDGGPRVITQADLLANATDIDGGALVASNLQLVAGAGSLLDNGDGTWTYTPAADDDTAAAFSYTISDGNGGSVGGTASLDLTPVNDAPTTTPVALAPLAEGGIRVITQADLLANATDIDGGALLAGNLQLVAGSGSLLDNGDGTWTYTPAANDDTAAAFSYSIDDGNGGSVGGSATLDLLPANDPPTTTPVTLAPLAEDGGPRVITQADLLANAADVDGNPLVAGNLQLVAGAGSLRDNGDGTWTYTPAADDDTAAAFSYTIADGNGGSVGGTASLDLTPVNDAPLSAPVVLAPLAEDGAPRVITQAQLLANATDIDGGALVAVNLQLVAGAGALRDNGDGTWTYTPAADDDTAAAFSYTISDGNGGSVGGTASLDLTPVNDAPTTTAVVLAPLAEDGGPRLITQAELLANAADIDGGALVAGNLQLVAGAGALRDNGDGTWTYTPAADDDTAAAFSYTIADGNGGSVGGTASLDLTPVNDAPTTTAVVLAPLAEDGGPRLITQAELLARASDVDGNALVAGNLQLVAGAGALVDNGNGTWTYTPAADDDTAAAFGYTITDGNGGSVAGTATLDLTPVNDAPTLISDGGGASATLARGENALPATVVTARDIEGDTLRYSLAGGADAALFQLDAASGALVFAAAPDFELPADANGDGVYEVVVQADDGRGGLATQALRIVVGNVNEAPAPLADAIDAVAGQPVMVATTVLLANDADVDGDTLQVVAVSAPSFGTLSQDPAGNWVYTPVAGFAGSDRFTYTVADAAGLKATAEVNVVVLAADFGGAMTGGTPPGGGSTAAVPPVTGAPAIADGGTDGSIPGSTGGGEATSSDAPAGSDAAAGATDPATDDTGADTVSPGDGNPAAAPAATDPAELLAPLYDANAIFGPPAGGATPAPADAGDVGTPSAFALGQQVAARERALDTRQWAPVAAIASKDGLDALLGAGAQQALGLFRSLALDATPDDVGHSLRAFRDLLDDIGEQASVADREVAEVVVGSGVVLSAGAVAWLLRAGALGASLLSVLPAWSTFDPIPVIRRRRHRRADEPAAPADLAAEAALARVLRPGLQRATPDAS